MGARGRGHVQQQHTGADASALAVFSSQSHSIILQPPEPPCNLSSQQVPCLVFPLCGSRRDVRGTVKGDSCGWGWTQQLRAGEWERGGQG